MDEKRIRGLLRLFSQGTEIKLKLEIAMTARTKAVQEGRAFVEVSKGTTGRFTTVGVCPACWNTPVCRKTLLAGLAKRGFAVVHGEDGVTGRYLPGKAHAPNCPMNLAGR
jgi:hypothetical protein